MTQAGSCVGVTTTAMTSRDDAARFSPDGCYRYILRRDVSPPGFREPRCGTLNIIGLNPSTADQTHDDPTVRRCVGFARSLCFETLTLTNVFAWRATNPRLLERVADPVGPDNDHHIVEQALAANFVIVAWSGKAGGRGTTVAANLELLGIPLWCLGLTLDGSPRHPLYMPAETQPRRFSTCFHPEVTAAHATPRQYPAKVTSRSGRGRWERVLAARRQAREALGRDPAGGDLYAAPPRRKAPPAPPPAPTIIAHGPGVEVLMVGEAAMRLGMSRAQLEAMIARGQVATLPIEFGCVIPTIEVERPRRQGDSGR